MVAFDYSFHVSTSYPTVFEQWKELNSDYDTDRRISTTFYLMWLLLVDDRHA